MSILLMISLHCIKLELIRKIKEERCYNPLIYSDAEIIICSYSFFKYVKLFKKIFIQREYMLLWFVRSAFNEAYENDFLD